MATTGLLCKIITRLIETAAAASPGPRGASMCGDNQAVRTENAARPERITTMLLLRQLEGIDSWNCARRERQQTTVASDLSRDARVDTARQLQALDRAHRALVARLDTVLAVDPQALRGPAGPCAVLIHRQQWFVERLTDALADLGVSVVGVLDDGADAVGVLVADQPDLALVEESLPTMTGRQVIAEARRFCPATAMVAQVADGGHIGGVLDAGARAAFTRRLRPADAAEQMCALLEERP